MHTAEILERILFLTSFSVLGLLLARYLRLDISLGCLLAGLGAGWLVPATGFDTGIRAHNLQDLVFLVILPILVFEAAWHLRPSSLQRWLLPVLLLAIPGVVLACLLGAAILYFAMDHPTGFPWIAALVAATILAATDPASVTARLRELDAPEGLATLIEGESLFNDASTIVLYAVVLSLALGAADTPAATVIGDFFLSFFGGTLFGCLAGLLCAGVIRSLRTPAGSSIMQLFVALASFYVAEELLGVSGIMAVTFAALISRYLLRDHLDALLVGTADNLQWVGLLLNALLFTLMGLVVTLDMFSAMWVAMSFAIAATLIARLVTVACCAGLSGLLGRKIRPQWQGTLVWGGLRGAVAIALVLALPDSLPWWWTVQSMVFGVVLFSLVVQGGTIGLLLKRVRL